MGPKGNNWNKKVWENYIVKDIYDMIWWLDSMTKNGTRETAPHGEVLEGLECSFSLIFKQKPKIMLGISCKQQIQTTCTSYSLSICSKTFQ